MIIFEDNKYKVITMSGSISFFNTYEEAAEYLQEYREDNKNERD